MNFTKDISRRGFMRIFGAAGVTAAALPVIGQSQEMRSPRPRKLRQPVSNAVAAWVAAPGPTLAIRACAMPMPSSSVRTRTR